jgi:hypothetical protein
VNSTQTHTPYRHQSLGGPIVLIALGVLLLLDQLVPGWGVSKTWPMILIVIGVVKLVHISQPPRPPEGPRI